MEQLGEVGIFVDFTYLVLIVRDVRACWLGNPELDKCWRIDKKMKTRTIRFKTNPDDFWKMLGFDEKLICDRFYAGYLMSRTEDRETRFVSGRLPDNMGELANVILAGK